MTTILSGNVKAETVREYANRAQNLEDEMDELKEDLKALHKEAEENGIDVQAFKGARAEMKRKSRVKPEKRETLDAYLIALGDFATTPLSRATAKKDDKKPAATSKPAKGRKTKGLKRVA